MSTPFTMRMSDKTRLELDACAALDNLSKSQVIARAVTFWHFARCTSLAETTTVPTPSGDVKVRLIKPSPFQQISPVHRRR